MFTDFILASPSEGIRLYKTPSTPSNPPHAGMLVSDLGICRILIPKVASAFCAFGEIISDMKHNYLSSYTYCHLPGRAG